MQNLLELIAQRRAELAREQLAGIGPITDEIRAAALRSAIDRADNDPVAAETLRRVSEHESMGPPFRVLMAARAAKIAADKARRLEEAAATAIADPQRPRVPQGESKWPLTGYVDEWGKTQHVGDEIVDIALENNPIDLSPPALKPLPIASKAVSLPLQRLLKRLRNKDEDGTGRMG